MSFLSEFDEKYKVKLGKRAHTFRKIFELLESRQKEFYCIVETGCIRNRDNMDGDGSSTLLFDRFINTHDGILYSVDINKKHCELASSIASGKTTVSCDDSINFLWNFSPQTEIDLVYLDSFDIDIKNPHPSMIHHMYELCAILPKLKSGTLLVVDDQLVKDGPGKGVYVAEFMAKLHKNKFMDDYQIGWII